MTTLFNIINRLLPADGARESGFLSVLVLAFLAGPATAVIAELWLW